MTALICLVTPLKLVYFDFSPFGLERRVYSLKEFVIFLSSKERAIESFSSLFMKIGDDTARGRKYLLDNNIVHRDLKPRNILISNQMYCDRLTDKEVTRKAWEKEPIICKLVDFGKSTVSSAQTTNIDRGTSVHMAPE